MKKNPRVAIVGGGISGLSCAIHLQELSKKNNFPIEISLFESNLKLGGTISTIKQNDCILELGPDSIFTEKPAALQFVKKVGLGEDWIGTNPNFRKSFIAFRNRLYTVPEGFYLLAPSRLVPLLISPLFSLKGKCRMLLEPFLPSRKSMEDESLASFVRRRFGEEVLTRVAQPMVGGIYSTDPEELSLEVTFPKFLEWEREVGSVIRGLVQSRKSSHHQAQGPRYSLFVTLKEGLGKLIEQIQEKLSKEFLRLGTKVMEVQISSNSKNKFRLILDKDLPQEFDAVCLATPAYISSKILKNLDSILSQELSKIEYASCATVNLVYKKEDFKNPVEGFGFVVPASEGKIISGCTFSTTKFPGRAPEDKIILRAFVGGKHYSKIALNSEDDIVRQVKKELNEILSLKESPLFTVVHQHEKALPQYKVGHRHCVEAIQEKLKDWKGLELCGNGYTGTGIPDCIESGEKAAEKLFTAIFHISKH